MRNHTYTHRDLPSTPARIAKHLDFCVSYRELEAVERANFAHGFADHARAKRRQHQQSLADIRAAR